MSIDIGEAKIVPVRGGCIVEPARVIGACPETVKSVTEDLDYICTLEDNCIVILDIETPPGEISRSANGDLGFVAIHDYCFIMLQVTHVLTLYIVVLIGHIILSWISQLARPWYPPRVVKLIAETIFTLTDPPLKFLRRYIPPLRIGTMSLDLSFMVLFIVVLILLRVAVPRL